MATYYARKTGNVNAADVWATSPTGTAGAVTLTASDILVANSFAVTINVNTAVAEIRNDNTGGATAGGSFTLSGGVSLTANVSNGSATTTLVASLAAGMTTTITGNLTGSSLGIACIVGTGVATGVANIVGNITAGSGTNLHGLTTSTVGTVNITGSVTGSFGAGVNMTGSGTVNITGTVTGGALSANGIGALLNGSGTINVFGTVIGGAVAAGAQLQTGQVGTLSVTRAKGNGYGNGSVGLGAIVGLRNDSQGGVARVSELEYGDLGQSPTTGAIAIDDSTSNVVLLYRPSLAKKTLTDPAATVSFPSASDVRSGVSYNSGSQVGTLAVPLPSQVAAGIATDATTGTAALTPAAVWDALTSGLAASGSIGERLKNAATVASTGQQLADALGG